MTPDDAVVAGVTLGLAVVVIGLLSRPMERVAQQIADYIVGGRDDTNTTRRQ